MDEKLDFSCDYLEGAHENILKRLVETNGLKMGTYGDDSASESARDRIRKACECPGATVQFLIGGTQTNTVVIDALLESYQGVLGATSAHVNVREAGAIEADGHKFLSLEQHNGKIDAQEIEKYLNNYEEDSYREHLIMPGMVYISQPTEYGTLYSKAELTAISEVCHKHHIYLYVDGARMAYALGSEQNDVTLPDMAKLCDAFYIGGTKCGALCGEAVVVPDPKTIPHFITVIKQHGALEAKGRLLGIQFDELFKDNLYETIGKNAVDMAQQIKAALKAKGYQLLADSPTNQIYFVMDEAQMEKLSQHVKFSVWEKYDDTHTIARFSTSWASKKEDVDQLISWL